MSDDNDDDFWRRLDRRLWVEAVAIFPAIALHELVILLMQLRDAYPGEEVAEMLDSIISARPVQIANNRGAASNN